MQSWKDLSRDCLRAAQLLRDKHPRSSISRAYYAAFSAGVWLTWEKMGPPAATTQRETTSHRELPRLLGMLLLDRGKNVSRDCRNAMLVLYSDRLTADYQTRRGQRCDSADAARAIRRANFIMRYCGVIQ